MEILQDRKELMFFLQVIYQTIGVPTKVLEVGVFKGGTLRLWQDLVQGGGSTIVGIDIVDYTGGYFRGDKRIHLLIGKSQDKEIIEETKKILSSEIDLLFIDGNHTYEIVKSDFENYSPLVRKGGIIAFHDIVSEEVSPRSAPVGCQVKRFWRELIDKKTGSEFYSYSNQMRIPLEGIGIMVKK